MKRPFVWLASTSPRRKAILKKFGVRFRAVAPDYEEHDRGLKRPVVLVRRHASEKALAAVAAVKEGTVVGADTVVWFEGGIIGKPKNLAEARRTLGRLQGRWHTVYTGVAIVEARGGRAVSKRVYTETTRVLLRRLTAREIGAYFRTVDPLDKAGSYAIQSNVPVVERVRGSFYNAMGLPAESLLKNLNIIK